MKISKKMSASLLLLAASLIWGGSFVVMKKTLATIPVFYLIGIRFFIGAIGLSYVTVKFKEAFTKKTILRGLIVGLCLFVAFTVQTFGLKYISSGKNALITAVYVVLVPFLMWIFNKKRPTVRSVVAAIMCFCGVAVLSLSTDSGTASQVCVTLFGNTLTPRTTELFGVGLTLISGIFYALHIAVVAHYSKETEIMPLTFLQFAVAAVLALTFAAFTEPFPVFSAFTPQTWLSIAYVGVLSTLIGFTFQNVGLRNASPAYASLILCFESLFGCAFGIIFLHESLTTSICIGAIIILASLVVSELKIKRRGGGV